MAGPVLLPETWVNPPLFQATDSAEVPWPSVSTNGWIPTQRVRIWVSAAATRVRTVCFWMFVPNGQQSESGMYGYGTRSCTDGRNNMWALRSFMGWFQLHQIQISALVLGSRSAHSRGCHEPLVSCFSHLHGYKCSGLHADNVSRTDWTRTEISTGENHGVQIGRFSDEAHQRRTFKGKISDFRIYDQALSSGDRAIIYNNGNGENLTPVSITSALEVNATLNSAFSYTITADDPNAVLNAIGLPQGLTVNQTTGLISGTPTIGGSYSVSLSAETSASTDVKTLTINLPVSAPQLSIDDPSLVYATTARTSGSLSQTGGRDHFRFLALRDFGRRDRNLAKYGKPWKQVGRTILERPDRTERKHDLLFPLQGDQFRSSTWTTTKSFTTPSAPVAPVLGSINLVSNITSNSAVLNTSLQANGGAATTAKFYWGTTDGGTNPSAWQNEINAGTAVPGVLNAVLSPGTIGGPNAYFVRTAFTNSVGTTWTPETLVFTTVAEPVSLPGLIAGGLTGNMSFDVNPGDLETHASGTGAENESILSVRDWRKYPPSLPGRTTLRSSTPDKFTRIQARFPSAKTSMTELTSPSTVTL